MNQERMLQVLIAPHLSEKSTLAADESSQHVFRVAVDADKREIKQAVESLFDVKVARVQVSNCKGKVKRFGARLGQRKAWKKAVVRLEPGHDIDFTGAES